MKKINYTFLILTLFNTYLFGCDMLVLQNINQYPIFTMPAQIGAFNDPYDFMEEFKSMANHSSGNRDGYGIVTYLNNSVNIDRNNMWYKSGFGNYFIPDNPDEPLYQVIDFLYSNENIAQVIAHARSATGGNGSHPFLFEANGKTYSFIHNGYIFNRSKRAIMEFLGEDWFLEHPSQWSGVFPDLNTFIDSELIFHYLMYHILQYPDSIEQALQKAFTNKSVAGVDMEYVLKFSASEKINFILSDSNNFYVYRSTRIMGDTYNLSYQVYPGKFLAIKTGSSLENIINKNKLLQFDSQGNVKELSTEAELHTTFSHIQVIRLDNGSHKLAWRVNNNTNIDSFNVYRGVLQDFTNSSLIAQLAVNSPGDLSFQIIDDFPTQSVIYYWIEMVFVDGSTELTTCIPSAVEEEEPEESATFNLRSLFPNPFKDKLYLNIDSSEKFRVKIFNLKGQLVDELHFANSESTLVWDTNNNAINQLANGVYILQFTHNNKHYSRKVLKIN